MLCVDHFSSHNSQVERCVTVDVDTMRLYIKTALQQEADDLLVSKSSAEMKGNVVLVVLSIYYVGYRVRSMQLLNHNFYSITL